MAFISLINKKTILMNRRDILILTALVGLGIAVIHLATAYTDYEIEQKKLKRTP